MSDGTLEKIDVRLARIESKIDNAIKKGERHSRVLFGETGADGLSGRVQTLEQSESRRTWHIRAIWTAVLGAVVSALSGVFSPK